MPLEHSTKSKLAAGNSAASASPHLEFDIRLQSCVLRPLELCPRLHVENAITVTRRNLKCLQFSERSCG